MVSKDQYELLNQSRQELENFRQTQSFNRQLSQKVIDFEPILRQHIPNFSICYTCSGSIANALTDIISLIDQYEENKQ